MEEEVSNSQGAAERDKEEMNRKKNRDSGIQIEKNTVTVNRTE